MPVLYDSEAGTADLHVPAGWTRVVKERNPTDQKYEVAILTRTYAASDGSQITLTQDNNHLMAGMVYAFRGKGISVKSTSVRSGSSVTHYIPDFTTVSKGEYVISASFDE